MRSHIHGIWEIRIQVGEDLKMGRFLINFFFGVYPMCQVISG